MRSGKSSPLNASKGIQCLYSSPFFCLDRVECKVSSEITSISCIRTLTLRSYSISAYRISQPGSKAYQYLRGSKTCAFPLRIKSQCIFKRPIGFCCGTHRWEMSSQPCRPTGMLRKQRKMWNRSDVSCERFTAVAAKTTFMFRQIQRAWNIPQPGTWIDMVSACFSNTSSKQHQAAFFGGSKVLLSAKTWVLAKEKALRRSQGTFVQ